MPSIVAGHLYTFLGVALVGMLLISTFSSYVTALRQIPEKEQLRNLLDYVAAKTLELVSQIKMAEGYSVANATLFLPSSLGNQDYWIRLNNDATRSWVEGGLGKICNQAVENRVFFPERFSSEGCYVGGYGSATICCYRDGSEIRLILNSGGRS
jgi:hypothetical protein